MSRQLCLCIACAGLAAVTFAQEACFTPYGTDSVWTKLDAWAVDGETPSAYPDGADVNVTLASWSNSNRRYNLITGSGTSSKDCVPLTLGSLIGPQTVQIWHSCKWTGMNNNYYSPYTLSIADPSGFEGYFYSGDALRGYSFPAAAGAHPQVSSLAVVAHPIIDVPTAGSTVELGSFYGRGAVEKRGAGDLHVKGAAGADSRLYVKAGSAILSGHADADTTSALVDTAAIHLDASDTTTLLGYTDPETTQNCVTNWLDVRHNGVKAWVPSNDEIPSGAWRMRNIHAPFVAAETSPSGRGYLDFGTSVSKSGEQSTAFGPTNCCLTFSQLTNAREVFHVARYHDRVYGNSVVGDRSMATLQPWNIMLGGSANVGAIEGPIFVNGSLVTRTYWPESGYGFTNLCVVSFHSASNMLLSTVASERYSGDAPSVGGMMVGEVLIFTNALSRADRQRVTSYLMQKWFTRGTPADADFGQVVVADGATLGVDEGMTARVTDLVSEADEIVKTGEGTLEVNRVFPPTATVSVRGGSVRFSAAPTVCDAAPATDPAVWLDASQTNTIDDTSAIGTWSDCRGSGYPAATAPNVKPTLSAKTSPTGLKAIEFGECSSKKYFNFPWWGDTTPRFCAGFAVVRQISSWATWVPIFGAKDTTFAREGRAEGGLKDDCIFVRDYHGANPGTSSALWTFNGLPVSPFWHIAALKDTTVYNVIAFNADRKLLLDGLAWGNNSEAGSGGMEIGEVLIYDRTLNEAERRDTEAYLMKKWNGAAHPAQRASSVTLAFDSADPIVVDAADDDGTLTRLSGGNGTLVKRGDGALAGAAATFTAASVSNLVIAGGSLCVDVSPADDGAYYRFDASALDTMTYTVMDGKTNVSVWADADGRAICATNITMEYAIGAPKRVPFLFPDGQWREGLDFGGPWTAKTCQGMWMSQSLDCQFVEGLSVYEQRGNDFRPSIFSTIGYVTGKSSPYTGTIYMRGNNGELTYNGPTERAETYNDWYVYDYASDTVVLTNGSCCLYDYEPHLVNTVPQTGCTVDAIAWQQIFGGGLALFEQVGFTNRLTTARRQWWQRHLAHKWFGQGEDPEWVDLDLESVRVAEGTEVRLSGAGNVRIGKVAGAGTLAATVVVSGLSAVEVDIGDLVADRTLRLDGSFVFDPNTTVVLTDGTQRMSSCRNYTLVEGTGVAGLDVSGWKVSAPASQSSRRFELSKNGDRIVLHVTGPGLAIIVK